MTNKVEIATRSFKSQKDATAHFREILYRYEPRQRINDTDAADLEALLARHPDRDEKIGHGISHFEVMIAEFGTRCFRVIRKDKTGIDFSLKECIKPLKK